MEDFVDWQAAEEIVLAHARQAIIKMATEHPDVVLSYFGLYAEPIYGVFLFSFDTPEQARRGARKEEQRALKHREERLRQGWFWEEACYLVNTPRLV